MSSQNSELSALKTRKQALENRIQAIERDIKSGLDPDSKEQAVQLENYEVLMGLLKNAEAELSTINSKIFDLEKRGQTSE